MATSAATEFVAWPGAAAWPPFESGELIRVELAFENGVVEADVLVGQDGFARAVRLNGAFNSRWLTDVTIHNPLDAAQDVEVTFMALGEGNVQGALYPPMLRQKTCGVRAPITSMSASPVFTSGPVTNVPPSESTSAA